MKFCGRIINVTILSRRRMFWNFWSMELFDNEMQEKGRSILDQMKQDNRLAILLIGRPYHSDPGLNHGVLEEFQVLGYPVLSMRSILKDEA
ncbi:acyl-CoA dehydratase activase-related protein [Paenibacillus etheri]